MRRKLFIACHQTQGGGNFKTNRTGPSSPAHRWPPHLTGNTVTLSLKTHLKTRKSHPIAQLGEPGPDDSQIEELVAMATRVPDHGKLQPWRFILYRGDSRHEIGERLAARYAEVLGRPLAPGETDKELTRFSRAPVVIGVVYVPRDNPKIPEWEMLLSAGAAAMNLLH
ncbi:MAG: nitroreductase family protein, partial [Notoacmeibacter sp.]|nr:nitroreductase family protein [Notoacmeibacter sp.]